jgi:IBR domain, a half RING-finger domain
MHSESTCASCLEDFSSRKMYHLTCQHSYCATCLRTLITTAMQTESMFPPKCCVAEIPLKEIFSALDRRQRELFKSKCAEYALKPENRWYCPNAKCGKWIPPSKLHRLRFLGSRCPSCDTSMCGICRGKAHQTGVDCPQDFGLEATLEEAERQGWRRCYKCRAMVELIAGCRHITCKCKAQFCYTCGAKWRTCLCSEIDQENRQRAIAERRFAFDELSRQDDADIALAIAEMEEMEGREMTEREMREAHEREMREAHEREIRQAIENRERRRREHLDRLEAEKRRLKQEAEEEAATTLRRATALRTPLHEPNTNLASPPLLQPPHLPPTTLNSELHAKQAHLESDYASLVQKLHSNIALRHANLHSRNPSCGPTVSHGSSSSSILNLNQHHPSHFTRHNHHHHGYSNSVSVSRFPMKQSSSSAASAASASAASAAAASASSILSATAQLELAALQLRHAFLVAGLEVWADDEEEEEIEVRG